MANLSSLYRLLSRYQNLLYETQQMVTILVQASDDLTPVGAKIELYYSIDEESADLKKIANCSERIESNKDFLNRTAIPTIRRQIEQIQREIEELESQEEEEEEVSR